MLNTKGLTMPEARFKAADGSIVKVQLPNTKLQFGAVYYDEKTHKGKLMCKCCDAPVHFRAGSSTIAGDNLRGPRPHFASNRRENHTDDCTVELAIDDGRDVRQFDLTKGYCFRLNTGELRESFSGRARPYGRRSYPHWEVLINNPDLKDREAYGVKNAENLQRLIGKKQDERVRNAVVVNGSDIIAMKDFFFRYSYQQKDKKALSRQQPRMQHLVDLLQEFGNNQLILMEVDLTKPKYAKDRIVAAESRHIRLPKKDENGYTREIVPRVIAARHVQETIANAIVDKDRYLVMGIARLKTKVDEETKKITQYVELKVNSADWIARVKLDDSDRLVRKKAPANPQLDLTF